MTVDGQGRSASPSATAPIDQVPEHSAPTANEVEIMGDGGSATATARGRLRRSFPLLIGALVLALIITINLLPGQDEDDAPLSPGNPAPEGARAVAQVLEAQGIDVVRVDSFDQALAEVGAGRSTLFLNDSQQYLSAGQVAELTESSDRSVLAAPAERQLESLDYGFAPVGTVPFDFGTAAPMLAAECPDEDATAASSISASGTLYSGGVECFSTTVETAAGEDGAGEEVTGGLYVSSEDGSVSILGAPAILANGTITETGNAALALRILGESPTLVWYEPTSADIISSGEGINPMTLLPGWVNPLLVWLLTCAVLAILWRGRRLGPLATEPLPVVVRAAETAEGRARLYQDSRAVAHAAANLRAAGLARIARRLRVDRSASSRDVLDAAARHTGRPRSDLEQQFLDRTPTSNRELVLWAQDILDLEKEITSS